jgi:uncharacterized protein YdaU (DUF1376 family)
MHYYQKNIGDYRRDTMNLSLLEHGVYMTLIDHYTLNEEPFPLDQLDICWAIGARTDDEKTAVCLILSKFFIETKKGYSHKRCDEEIAKYHAKSDTARVNANKRWDSNAKAMQTHSKGNANHKPITNNQEPLTNKDFDKFWEAYPNKKSKPLALKAWLKHKPDINVVMKSLTIFKKCEQWTRDKGRYIPYPASWLNAEGWNDVIETKKTNSTYL